MCHKLNFGFQGDQYQIRQVLTESVLRELASKGVPIKRMAKMLGESATTIDRYLNKYGIEHMRTMGRPHSTNTADQPSNLESIRS